MTFYVGVGSQSLLEGSYKTNPNLKTRMFAAGKNPSKNQERVTSWQLLSILIELGFAVTAGNEFCLCRVLLLLEDLCRGSTQC
jgi:hypothetical protein